MEQKIIQQKITRDSYDISGLKELRNTWMVINDISREYLNLDYSETNWKIVFNNLHDCSVFPEELKFVSFDWLNLRLLIYKEPSVLVLQFENYNQVIDWFKKNEEKILADGLKVNTESEYKRLFLLRNIDKHKIKELKKGNTTIKVNQILHTSWGYDQTNTEFFIIKKIIGQSYFIIQEIAGNYKPTLPCQGEKKVNENSIKIDIPRRAYISKSGHMEISSSGYRRSLFETDLKKSYYVSER